MATAIVKKDEMIIYIDSDPNQRIAAPADTLFWRNDKTFYLVQAQTNQLVRIDLPLMVEPKYMTPMYKNYKFVYTNKDETWIKTTSQTEKTGWKLLKYAPPTINAQQGPVPTQTIAPPWTGSFEGCFTGSFSGSFTGSFIVYNGEGDFTGTFYFITNSYYFSGSNYMIGTPTDGYYGSGSSGNAAGLVIGEKVEDALDKLDTIIDKLVPAKPPLLSTKTLYIPTTYSAKQAGTTFTIGNITNNANPTISLVGGMVVSNGFSDGDVGALSASLNGTTIGSCSLTTADDTGTYGDLQITNDYDYYAGQQGKQDFWKALLAQINIGTPLAAIGPYIANLSHTITGQTANYTFYKDDAVTPVITLGTVTGSGVSYISGVPALVGGVGGTIHFTMSAQHTVGRFYNATRIFSVGGTGLTTTNVTLPVSPASGSVQSATQAVSVNAGAYAETTTFTITAYNSAGTTTSVSIPTNIRLESTLDGTNRVKSGTSQFPSSGSGASQYGDPFDSTVSVATNEELQRLNGVYRYPTGNYTSALPVAGPNYSSVPVGSYNNMRWVTLNMGSVTNAVNLTFSFGNTSNFTGNGLPMSNFALYVKVTGTGWIDGNGAYPGVGNPTNDGDPALSVSNSTSTSKMVTFGTTVRSGTVYLRVGIPSGNNKSFGSVTMTAS